METMALPEAMSLFLDHLRRAGHSPHTLRTYRTELSHLLACHDGPIGTVTIATVRAAVARRDGRSPASRARTMTALNNFLTWVVRHDLLVTNPMENLDRVRVMEPKPSGLEHGQIDTILAVISMTICATACLSDSSNCAEFPRFYAEME